MWFPRFRPPRSPVFGRRGAAPEWGPGGRPIPQPSPNLIPIPPPWGALNSPQSVRRNVHGDGRWYVVSWSGTWSSMSWPSPQEALQAANEISEISSTGAVRAGRAAAGPAPQVLYAAAEGEQPKILYVKEVGGRRFVITKIVKNPPLPRSFSTGSRTYSLLTIRSRREATLTAGSINGWLVMPDGRRRSVRMGWPYTFIE